MLFPYLSQIFELLKTYTDHQTNRALGLAIGRHVGMRDGFNESTVRNWIGNSGHLPGEVPDETGEAIIAFVREQLSGRPSRDEAKRLLEGHPIYFHNALCPLSGRAWATLLSNDGNLQPLEVEIRPPEKDRRRGMAFGDAEDLEEASQWQMAPRSRYRFAISPRRTNHGEAFVLVERRGEWRPSRFQDKSLVEYVSGRLWWLPALKTDHSVRYFVNDGSVGCFRYVVVAANKLPLSVVDILASATPFDQFTLDTLGATLQSIDPKGLFVGATTIKVSDEAAESSEIKL